MPHPNEVTIRKGYEAFAKADLETIQKLFDPNCVLHVPGRSPISGDYKGRDEVLGFLGTIMSMSDGTFKTETHDIIGNDEHVTVLSHVTAKRAGKSLDTSAFEVYHVQNQKVTEAWFLAGDLYAQDEFWS